MKRITLYLFSDQVERLKEIARRRHISYAQLIREILGEWLEANAGK